MGSSPFKVTPHGSCSTSGGFYNSSIIQAAMSHHHHHHALYASRLFSPPHLVNRHSSEGHGPHKEKPSTTSSSREEEVTTTTHNEQLIDVYQPLSLSSESVYESAAKFLFLSIKWARSVPSFGSVSSDYLSTRAKNQRVLQSLTFFGFHFSSQLPTRLCFWKIPGLNSSYWAQSNGDLYLMKDFSSAKVSERFPIPEDSWTSSQELQPWVQTILSLRVSKQLSSSNQVHVQ